MFFTLSYEFFSLQDSRIPTICAIAMDATAKYRFDLIGENLAEIINPELIETVLAEKRNLRVYWGKAMRLPFPGTY